MQLVINTTKVTNIFKLILLKNIFDNLKKAPLPSLVKFLKSPKYKADKKNKIAKKITINVSFAFNRLIKEEIFFSLINKKGKM